MQSVGVILVAALLGLASGSRLVSVSAVRKDNPVTQIVTLLTELKARVEADGQAEQASYDKFACWCEDTLGEKATEISAAKETIEETQTLIIKLKGDIAAHAVEIKQLEKDIAANIESTREATEMREKENEAYEGEKTEAEQCMGALEAAIKVLTGAGSGKAFLGTLQEAQLLSVVAGVRGILQKQYVSKTLGDQDMQVVKRFVERPEDFVGGRTGVITAVQIANNPFGDYAPQSTQIQGILKGMYDSFAADLEKANVEEANKQKAFEELMETKKSELETLQSTLETQTTDEATKTKDLADSKTLLDDTKEQLEADEKFFAQTKSSCKTKAGDWASRTRLRTEELAGMAQAIEILSSDEAKETFDNATSSFLQITSDRAMGSARTSAYASIRKIATKYQSLALAKLATTVKTAGHFDKVIADIDKMIAILREEETEDIKQKDICERNENKNKNTIEDLNYDIEKADAAIKRMDDEAKEMETKIGALEKDIEDTEKSMEDLKELRVGEKGDFVQGVKDDTNAIALLEKAIAALAKFHNKAALVQKKAEPMPETSFQDGNYGGRKGESTGIIAILTMVKEDLAKEIKTARVEDGEAQVNYEKDRSAMKKTLDAQEASKLSVEKDLAALRLKIADLEEFKGQKNDDLTGEKDTEGTLETNCAWVKSHFETRRTKRKTEIDGLVDAKNFLAGVEEA